MRNTSFTITAPHLFLSVSVFSAESKSSIIITRFHVHGTSQLNQFNSQIFNSAFVQFLRITIKALIVLIINSI